jgi:putative membrane protein
MRRTTLMMIVITIPLMIPFGVAGAKQATPSDTASFLGQAAGGQQSEVDLGQLAVQKAENEQVKQFGTRMVEDHRKAHQEIRQLASKEGIRLQVQPSDQQQQQKAQLSKLSGKEFDRAYIMFMLRDHTKNMKHFGQHALVEPNPEVRQWTASALPVIKEHLEKVKTIASALGIDPRHKP